MRTRYPDVAVPNTRRAMWLADLVESGAFTTGGLLRRRVTDPDTGEVVESEVVRLTNSERCRAWYMANAERERARKRRERAALLRTERMEGVAHGYAG